MKKKNSFSSQYQLSGRRLMEDKPVNKTFFDENLHSYCINFLDHENFHNVFNSEELVSDSLTVFENNFKPHDNLRKGRFKCLFTIVNWQPASGPDFVEITNSRVWQTNVYYGVYFYDFIKSKLDRDILKCVIMNGISGSSWRFRRFNRVCITVNSDEIRSVGKYIWIKWSLQRNIAELMDLMMTLKI